MSICAYLFAIALGVPQVQAREVLREGGRAEAPEAWFVLGGPVRCEVTAVVGPDGVPVDARTETCPDVLAPALVEAAMRWRWVRGSETTAEEIEVPVAPPSFPPRGGRRCLVGFEVEGKTAHPMSDTSRRCALSPGSLAAVDTGERRSAAWCAVDVVTDESGLRSLEAPLCAEGYAETTIASLRSWDFPRATEKWRVIIGYLPAPP